MLKEFVNTRSFYKKAKNILPPDILAFIEGGSLDERTLNRNRKIFDDILLLPRVLRGITEVCTQTMLFDHPLIAPVLIAPSAYQRLLSENGELDMLGAANQFGTIMMLSMFSSMDYRLISKHKKGPVWLQMYFLKDKKINENIIQLAEELGFEAIVLTVDAPIYAKKERERRQPLTFPKNISFDHLGEIGIPFEKCLQTKKHFSTLLDPTISWDDLEWLSQKTTLPIILKGVMHPKDTEIALSYCKVAGIVVSNHGGRQLDSTFSALEMIQKHRVVAGNRVKLFLDGGIVRGSDIFKAIALGADAVLIGRTALWALASGGQAAVFKALSILQRELIEVMTLCGCSTVKAIVPDFVTFKGKR